MNFFTGRSKSVGNTPTPDRAAHDKKDDSVSPTKRPSKTSESSPTTHTLRVSSTDRGDSISVQRTDGITQDLLNVLQHPGAIAAVTISNKEENTVRERLPHEIQREEEGKITIPRSDGVTHDIVQVFRAATLENAAAAAASNQSGPGNTGEQPPVVHLRARLPSVGKLELSSPIGPDSNTITLDRSLSSLYYPKSVRIVHFSDTHNFLVKTAKPLTFLPHGDILVHTGNFTNSGTDAEFHQFNEWLGYVTDLYHYRIVILGHRDVKVHGNNWDIMKKLLQNATHVLCHEDITILGIRFYGAPWHWAHKVNYTLRPGAPSSTSCRFNDIPSNIHVLLTHGPAYERLDTTYGGNTDEHWGSSQLSDVIRKVRPGLHLHGHVKDSRGIFPEFGNMPLTVNSAMVDKDVTVLCEAPHVVRANQALFDKAKNIVTWSFSIDSLEG